MLTSPLGDATNTPAAPVQSNPSTSNAADATQIPNLEHQKALAELESLKKIVAGFSSKKRRRNKKKRDDTPSDDELENDAPAAKKSKRAGTSFPSQSYEGVGRVTMRYIGPFDNIYHTISRGLADDAALEGDEPEETLGWKRRNESWRSIWQSFPGFHELLLENAKDANLIKAIARQITEGMESARSDDTGTLKTRILAWLTLDPKTALTPAISGASKTPRGFNHPTTAELLCPLEYDANQSTYDAIASGTKDLKGDQLPRFLFPFGQADDTSALDTFCTGPVMLRSSKAIFMGPASALEGDGYHKGKASNAAIMGATTFTIRMIAYIACQVRFALSSAQEWNKMDGNFNYEEFFWRIINEFEQDPEQAQRTLALYNRVVLGASTSNTAAATSASAPTAPAMTHMERLKAARAAEHEAAHAAELAEHEAARAAEPTAATATTTAPSTSEATVPPA